MASRNSDEQDMVLGEYVIEVDGARHQLPITLNPSDAIIEGVVRIASCAPEAVVSLRCEPTPECGPHELILYVDKGNFLLLIGVNEADGDHSVRTLANESMPNDLMVIMGEKYPAGAVTRDIGLAYSAFDEFVRYGDVSFMQ